MKYDFRQSLLKQGVLTSDDNKLEAVLNNWIETHCSEVSWDNLIQVLTELEFIDIVQDVRRSLQKDRIWLVISIISEHKLFLLWPKQSLQLPHV